MQAFLFGKKALNFKNCLAQAPAPSLAVVGKAHVLYFITKRAVEHYAQYVTFLKEARHRIVKKFTGDTKKQLLAELLDPQLLQWVEQGDAQKCEAWLFKRLGEEKCAELYILLEQAQVIQNY
ncbi:hypothetical protein [Cytobacillus oceanisediminis]|uniref:hypothetical protein n=1 Tax=Cytobacillus oceanisediminis TaxID=665099 RepID=UPI0037362E61